MIPAKSCFKLIAVNSTKLVNKSTPTTGTNITSISNRERKEYE